VLFCKTNPICPRIYKCLDFDLVSAQGALKSYLRLRAAVLRDLKSKSTLDWIDAQDQIDKVWEEQRYKRAGVALNSSAVR
jgi:hypothetical protein